MTLDQIDAFLAVVKYGNFANAATSLYLTQSALGHRISKLEKELEVDLFMRARGVRRVELTEQGSQFVEIASQMKDLWTRALDLSGRAERSEVRIACIFSLQDVVVPVVVDQLGLEGLKPYIVSSNTRGAIDGLTNGDLDFAIVGYDTPAQSDAYSSDVLADEEFVMVSRPDSPYSLRMSVRDLDTKNEVFSKWSPALESWHTRVFGDSFMPLVSIENCDQLDKILELDVNRWAIAPIGFANASGFKVTMLEEKLPTRRVALLSKRPFWTTCQGILIESLRDSLSDIDGFDVPF